MDKIKQTTTNNKTTKRKTKSFIKNEFNTDIEDFRLLDFLSQHLSECCQEDEFYNLNLDVDKIKEELKTDNFFNNKIEEYAKNIPEYAGGPYLAMSEIIDFANNIEKESGVTKKEDDESLAKKEIEHDNNFGL